MDPEGGFLTGKENFKLICKYVEKHFESGFRIWTTAYKRKPIYFKQPVQKVAYLFLFDDSRWTILHTMIRIQAMFTNRFRSQTFRITALWSATSASHTSAIYFQSYRLVVIVSRPVPSRLQRGNSPHLSWKQSLPQSEYYNHLLEKSSC